MCRRFKGLKFISGQLTTSAHVANVSVRCTREIDFGWVNIKIDAWAFLLMVKVHHFLFIVGAIVVDNADFSIVVTFIRSRIFAIEVVRNRAEFWTFLDHKILGDGSPKNLYPDFHTCLAAPHVEKFRGGYLHWPQSYWPWYTELILGQFSFLEIFWGSRPRCHVR